MPLDPTAAGVSPSSELALLKRFLFTPPERLADPARPRSTGPDGSVDLEQHPGIEDEIDAAALWVAEQVSDGVPAEAIGLIVPDTEPYAQLLIDRLARIGGGVLTANGEVAAYVAGGVPLTTTPAGIRLLALLRAWQRSLNAEAVLRILPALRREGEADASPRLTPSRAAELVYGAGIVGGSPGDPTGAREWLPRLERRRRTLEQVVADADTVAADEPEKQRHRWDRQNAQEWLDDLVPLLPAIGALQQVADLVIAEAPLVTLWEAVQAFVRRAYHVPPDPPNLLARLAEALEPVVAESAGVQLTGPAALDVLVDTLRRERRAVGRFGEPRIFIGTPAAAAGIELTAVRVLGLAEGALPRTPHDDPIVPSALRSVLEDRLRPRIPALAVPRVEDRVLDELHAFYRVVADTGERLALSAPRQWTERSEREVSGILLEVAAALARPVPSSSAGQGGELPTGRRTPPPPGIASRLRSGYFAPGRARRERFASTSFALARTNYLLVPHRRDGTLAVPPQWLEPAVLAVDRVRVLADLLESSDMSAIDGVLGAGLPPETIPGLSPRRALSATALTTLLKCPQWFLFRYVLSMKEPTRPPATDTLDPLPYGQLFHTAAEAFFRADGETFCRAEGTVEEWVDRATKTAAAQFDARQEEYSLRGVDAIARERLRLRNQIEQMVRYEWTIRSRTFVDTERPFGEPEALALRLGERTLFVAGKIDRVDRSGSHLSVRDLKTGRVRDLIEEPINPGRDLQIGLYALVLEHEMGPEVQVAHAAYVHPSAAGLPERAFRRSQMDTLRVQTRRWLEIAADLLRDGAFVRTPVASDCDYCPYRPACGDGAQARSALKLTAAGVPAAAVAFVRLKSELQNE